jgi:hypothetical protein
MPSGQLAPARTKMAPDACVLLMTVATEIALVGDPVSAPVHLISVVPAVYWTLRTSLSLKVVWKEAVS